MGEPLYVFDDPKVFNAIHRKATEADHAVEAREINEFNEKKVPFKAWIMCKIQGTKDWLFLLQTGEGLFPRIGENCKLRIMTNSGKSTRSEWFRAERIENDCAMYGPAFEKLAAFSVSVKEQDAGMLKKPLMDGDKDIGQGLGKKSMMVCIEMSLSSKTMEAELAALFTLMDSGDACTEDQKSAFKWLMDFKNPEFNIDLFERLPWMARPLRNEHRLPQKIVNLYGAFDADQKVAYRDLLANMPCGIGILPGCPGAGKTHWNMVVSAMAQAKAFRIEDGNGKFQTRSIKILYLLDINKPLDDICMKFKKTYEAIGLKKTIVRVQNWLPTTTTTDEGSDKGSSVKLKLNREWKFLTVARLKRRASILNRHDVPLSLEEAAWELLQKHKTTKYFELHGCLETLLGSRRRNKGSGTDAKGTRERYNDLVNELYQDLLENEIDILFSTPVAASTGFSNLFKPDFVFFDESPHARELSTLIAIANFEAIWFFTGDHRQTRPFVRSEEAKDNKYAKQLLTSTMERAVKAGVVPNQLLINHRAYANLHHLPSKLFYAGQMKTAGEPVPRSTDHLRENYLVPLIGPGKSVKTPRILVNVTGQREFKEGTSFYNPAHMDFVCNLIGHLARDADFKRVGANDKRGTVLLVTPYKESVSQYRAEFNKMGLCQENGKEGRSMLCEVRSIETVQGGEADVVIVDFVRDRCTEFTNDPNRLCVALSRARQAEILVMSPNFHKGANMYSPRNVIGGVVGDALDSQQIATVAPGQYPAYKMRNMTKPILTPAQRYAENAAFLSGAGPAPAPAPAQSGPPRRREVPTARMERKVETGRLTPYEWSPASKPSVRPPSAKMEALELDDVGHQDSHQASHQDSHQDSHEDSSKKDGGSWWW